MKPDEITRVVKSDNKFQHNYIRTKLREMGRLLIQLRIDSNNPSLALKLGHSLRKCAKICQGQAIEMDHEEKRKKIKSFLKLMDINWSEEMSSNALRTLYEAKRHKVKLLPLVGQGLPPDPSRG